MIRVLIADDHPLMRSILRKVFTREKGIEVIGEAQNGAEVLRLLEKCSADVVILDIEMPEMTGIQVFELILKKDYPVRVIILSNYAEELLVRETLRMGAAGYIVKEEAPTYLIKAVRGAVISPDRWLSPIVASYAE